MAVKFFGSCRIRINTQLSPFQMSQRERVTVAASDTHTQLLTICWPVSFQIQERRRGVEEKKKFSDTI